MLSGCRNDFPASETLPGRDVLDARVRSLTAEYDGRSVPRPSFWSGYVLSPRRVEFWKAGTGRLHDRELFERAKRNGY